MNKRLFVVASITILGLASCDGGQTRTQIQTVTHTSTLTQTTIREMPTTSTVTETATVTITSTATVTVTVNPIPTDHRYQITSPVIYEITQQTSTYWYFSWNMSIKNLDSLGIELGITINFVDKDGNIMEWDNELVLIGAGQTKTIFGQTIIPAGNALNVTSAIPIIELI